MRTALFLVSTLALSATANAQWAPGSEANYRVGSNSCATLATPYWTPCPGRVSDPAAPFNWLGGYIVGGRLDANPIFPDFAILPEIRYWGTARPGEQDGTPKLKARSLILGDLGDTPDIQLRASGPDQGAYNGEAAAFAYKGSPTTVGKIYGQVLAPDCYGLLEFVAGCGHWGRTGVLEFGITGTPTATSRPSFIAWGNNPPNSADYRRDFFSANAQLMGLNVGSASDAVFAVPCATMYCGMYGDPWGVKFSTWGLNGSRLGGSGFNFPNSTNDTTLTLVVRKAGNVMEVKPVSVGDASSCGSGYRCLRVPN